VSIEKKMPTLVTFRVKRWSSLPVNEPAKKQRTANVPRIQCEEEVENDEVAQSAITNEPSTANVVRDNDSKRRRLTWDQRFQELVDFKKINGHTNVPTKSGQLGTWVNNQRIQYCLLNEGNHSALTNERREKLESIGFVFKVHPPWDQRFQELVDFKKINGHTNIPTKSGQLGTWVNNQRAHSRLLNEGKEHHLLTNERRDKLERLGFSFNIHKK
jgi:hypothetical protein